MCKLNTSKAFTHLLIYTFTHLHIYTLYMILEILTPERKLFSGEVYGVQLPGIDGLFEVLDKHAPLVSAIKIR